MLEAIVREWRSQPLPKDAPADSAIMRSESGGLMSYRAKPETLEQDAPAPDAPRGPKGEYYGEGVPLAKAFAPQGARSSQAARSKPPTSNQIGVVPPKDAIDAEYWTPPTTKSQKRRAAVQAAMTGVKPGQVMEYEGRRMVPVYDTKTGKLVRYMSAGEELKEDLD
jgi:hypothetical protein